MGNLKKLVQRLMVEENIPLHRMRSHLEACGYVLCDVLARGEALQKGVPQKYSQEDVEQVKKLKEAGWSLSEIAGETNVPVGSVSYILGLKR